MLFMKKFILIFIVISIFSFNNIAIARIAIIESDEFKTHQWGALEDILNDWHKNLISTDECAIYGCYVLSAQDSRPIDNSQIKKLIPQNYILFKKSINKEPYFFINEIYKIEPLLNQKALDEFHNSEWSDYEFIQEIINNNEFTKVIKNSPFLRDDNGNEYKDFCNVMKSAYAQNLIKPETIYFISILPRINPQRYINQISLFWNQNKLKCISNCQDSLENLISSVDPSTFNKNKKLIKVINLFWYNLCNTKSIYKNIKLK